MSSLKKYKQDPSHLLNTALHIFKSKKTKTAVVEGVCDKRFLSQWSSNNAEVRFDGFDGKPLVNSVFQRSQSKPYSDYDFLYFFADIDYDVITGRQLNNHAKFIYNSFCFKENKLHFNDLETYLVNTNAFSKVLANHDIDAGEAQNIREQLKRVSRFFGSFRAADIIIQKSNQLRSSVLNGLSIEAFLNARNISAKEEDFIAALPRWANYREYVSELITEAQRLDRETPDGWSLSRGHDITEILALHLSSRFTKTIRAEVIELMLRLACEYKEFKVSPMGKQLTLAEGIAVFSFEGES